VKPRRGAAALCCAVLLGGLAGCSGDAQPPVAEAPAPPTPAGLAAKVTIDGMKRHLQALADIATANKGNRADGTPGFTASVDYVVKTLRDRGFTVDTPEVSRLNILDPGQPAVTVAGRVFQVDQASQLLPTPAGDVNAAVVQPVKPAGCAAADYRPGPKGRVAVTDDTGCAVGVKARAAADSGAAALLVVSDGGRNGSPAGLFSRGYYNDLPIPVGVIGSDGGAAMRRSTGPVRVRLDSKAVKITSRNILAQTTTGSPGNIVMAGAHLDSVSAGPGINDNGSGVAAVLETALALGPDPSVHNAVRFAFWGGEEQGLNGSLDYLFALDRDQLNAIALYLNFDMLASPNAGFFTLDGDLSGPAAANPDPDEVPIGSAGGERTLAGYLNLAGKRPADLGLTQRSDFRGFMTAGVPVGGITTGAADIKTNTQARLWGGKAGVAFDPNYHTARDTLAAINADALAVAGPGVAFAVATYADSIDGVNGVPGRDKRHRAVFGVS